MKYSTNHYEYIQPMDHQNEIDFKILRDGEIIIPKADIYSSPKALDGIVKNTILLYILVMSKYYSLAELLSSNNDNERKSED